MPRTYGFVPFIRADFYFAPIFEFLTFSQRKKNNFCANVKHRLFKYFVHLNEAVMAVPFVRNFDILIRNFTKIPKMIRV